MSEIDELVKRLRDVAFLGVPDFTNSPVLQEAAAALEVQAKRIEELEEKLRIRGKKIDQLVDDILETSDRLSEIKAAVKLATINLHNTEYADVLIDLRALIEATND